MRLVVAAIFIFIAIGCSTPPGRLGKLDLQKWRSDRRACQGIRSGLVADFKAEQGQLLGKFADEIGELLGKPDIHQLGDRNQKFYVYFLEKGEQCEDIKMKSTAKKVILRFNAVGLLSEITYQKEPLSQL